MSFVEIGVEALQENRIQEVTYDGKEIYVKPLSMSENLTKLTHKIDFSKNGSDDEQNSQESEKEDEEKEKAKVQPSLWPWDSVRNKLKSALTECNVLLDVMQIAKEKKYMTLDPVQQDVPESRNGVQYLAKKRSLAAAGSILVSGADRLKRSQEQSSKRTAPDYHQELLKLRAQWRLKKVGAVILGDLSYKTAGSRFYQNGTFEVRKSEEVGEGGEAASGGPTHGLPRPSALHVTVPAELEGSAVIQIAITKIPEGTDVCLAQLSLPEPVGGPIKVTELHWHKKLEAAHNVIFCKEVFAQLAREATQSQSKIPHIVVGNRIFSHLFPGMQLSIALWHYTSKSNKASVPAIKQEQRAYFKAQNQVLEHAIHQLLRELHIKNAHIPWPHPVTGLLGVSKRRRLAGPHAHSREQIIEASPSTSFSLLEQIIAQARHILVRERTIAVIDEVAASVQNYVLTAHCSPLSSATQCLIKMHINSQGCDVVRTAFSVHIDVDQLLAVTRESKKLINMSCEEQELRDFLLDQISSHHIIMMRQISKWMGWEILSINMSAGVGELEKTGNAYTIMLASPRGDRVLSVKSGAHSGLKIKLQRCPADTSPSQDSTPVPAKPASSIVTNSRWQLLGGPFEEIKLDRIDGRTFTNKMETFMACTANINAV